MKLERFNTLKRGDIIVHNTSGQHHVVLAVTPPDPKDNGDDDAPNTIITTKVQTHNNINEFRVEGENEIEPPKKRAAAKAPVKADLGDE